MESFIDQLAAGVRQCGNPILVGLDPRWEWLPEVLRGNRQASLEDKAEAYGIFCRGIVDVVAPLVAAVKPQAAFFEELGAPGMSALAEVIGYAQQAGLLVILDAKRNDIGSTAAAYARGLLGRESAWRADALTVSPYLGSDSLSPFMEIAVSRQAGLFVLVKTSNPGGGQFQDLLALDQPLFRHVADYVESLAVETLASCGYGAVGAVVGATFPQQLKDLRKAMPHTWFLVPGFGSQGATAVNVASAFDERGTGAVINSSRDIIFAHRRAEYAQFGESRWQEAVDAATRDMMHELCRHTPARRLAKLQKDDQGV